MRPHYTKYFKKLPACHNTTALKTHFILITPFPIPIALWYQLKTFWSIPPSNTGFCKSILSFPAPTGSLMKDLSFY